MTLQEFILNVQEFDDTIKAIELNKNSPIGAAIGINAERQRFIDRNRDIMIIKIAQLILEQQK
jgi:hypothetical protein